MLFIHLFSGEVPKELILSGNGITSLSEDAFSEYLTSMFKTHGDDAYILLDRQFFLFFKQFYIYYFICFNDINYL